MWQSFLVSSSIKIGLHKLNAYTIMNKILRYKLPLPKISAFMINPPDLESECQKYQVHEPHKLLSFGLYLPLSKMPKLRVYSINDFDNELKMTARFYLSERIKLKENNLLIELPKFIDWFTDDQCSTFLDLLTIIEKE